MKVYSTPITNETESSNIMISPTRTVSADPGLLSHEELLANYDGRRRRTLEELITKEKLNRLYSPKDHVSQWLKRIRKRVRWFIDHARIKISYGDFMMAVTIFVLFGDDVRILCGYVMDNF